MNVSTLNNQELADLSCGQIKSYLNMLDGDHLEFQELLFTLVDAIELKRSTSQRFRMSEFVLFQDDINPDIFNKFQVLADKLGTDTGHLINTLMSTNLDLAELNFTSKHLVHLYTGNIISISHHELLSIKIEDLQIEERVNISHVNNLKFGPNVDDALLRNKINQISHCGKIFVAEKVSPLVLFSLTQFCSSYHFY